MQLKLPADRAQVKAVCIIYCNRTRIGCGLSSGGFSYLPVNGEAVLLNSA